MSIIAHIDCNNFYVSCERIFNPSLKNTPVIILSNNDGCVVSRSDEAKSLGIGMGVPYFRIKELAVKNNVKVFSSNYTLYGDISTRVMNLLSEFTPNIEYYSIDEAFLNFKNICGKSLTGYASLIRKTILKNTGIPVSIGIAETKTLSKIANEFAKKNIKLNGVFDISRIKNKDTLLKQVPVHDVWGIGSNYAKMLFKNKILSAYDFKNSDENWIKEKMNVTGLRSCLELRGISCIKLEEFLKSKKGIMSSKSFGKYVTELGELSEAVSQYTCRAAEKLRKQNSICGAIHVFIQTNHFKLHEIQHSTGRTVKLNVPTSFTPDLISNALFVLNRIYLKGYKYIKAGVYLSDIFPEDHNQQNMFVHDDLKKMNSLMNSFDCINNVWGRDTIKFASSGINQIWKMKMNFISKRFTTNWNELLTIKI